MSGGIAEVNASSAAIPPHSTLDRDARFSKAALPQAECVGSDGKGQVHGSSAIMRWDPTAWPVQPGDRRTALEEEKDGRLACVHRHEARTRIEYAKAKDVSIEPDDCVEIVHVERSLQNAGNSRGRNRHGYRGFTLVLCVDTHCHRPSRMTQTSV